MPAGLHLPRPAVVDEFLAAYGERDWATAVTAIDRHWTTLVFSPDTVEQVIAVLHQAPEDELLRRPRAALIAETFGRLPLGSTTVTVPGNAARIDEAMRTGTARELVELSTLAMVGRRAAGLPQEAVAIVRASRPLVRATSVTRFSPAADLAAYWYLQAGQAALHVGDLDQARTDFEHAWTFADHDVTGYVAPSTAPFLALLAALVGDPDEADRWQGEVDRLEPGGRALVEWDTMERPRLTALLLTAADRLDTDDGQRLADLLLQQLAFDETWPVTLFAVVRHLVNIGAAARAEQLIGTTVERYPDAPTSGTMHAAFVSLARADVALGLGRGSVLAPVLASAPRDLLRGIVSVYAVHLEVLAGDLPAARRAATIGEQSADGRVRRESRLLGTAIDLALGGTAAPATAFEPDLRRAASLLPADLNAPLRAAYGAVVPPSNSLLAEGTTAVVKLTPREARVLAALAQGGSLPEIADRLYISRNTLKTHLRALYAKLGVSSREDAVDLGRALGLLDGA